MKASDILQYLKLYNSSIFINGQSCVDETKSRAWMLNYWIKILEDKSTKIGSIIKYNIEKDFPTVFSDKKIESEKV